MMTLLFTTERKDEFYESSQGPRRIEAGFSHVACPESKPRCFVNGVDTIVASW